MKKLELKKDTKLEIGHVYSICFRGVRNFEKDVYDLAIVGPFHNAAGDPLLANISYTKVILFRDLDDRDCWNNYDKSAQSTEGLLEAMQNVYHDFDEREIVTLVNFVVVR